MVYSDFVRSFYQQHEQQERQQQTLETTITQLRNTLVKKDYMIIALQTRLRHLLLTNICGLTGDDLDIPDPLFAEGVEMGLHSLKKEEVITLMLKKETTVQGLVRQVSKLKYTNERLREETEKAKQTVGRPKSETWAGCVPSMVIAVNTTKSAKQASEECRDICSDMVHDLSKRENSDQESVLYNLSDSEDSYSMAHEKQTSAKNSHQLLASSSFIMHDPCKEPEICQAICGGQQPQIAHAIVATKDLTPAPRALRVLQKQYEQIEGERNSLEEELVTRYAEFRFKEHIMAITIEDLQSQVKRLRSVIDSE